MTSSWVALPRLDQVRGFTVPAACRGATDSSYLGGTLGRGVSLVKARALARDPCALALDSEALHGIHRDHPRARGCLARIPRASSLPEHHPRRATEMKTHAR